MYLRYALRFLTVFGAGLLASQTAVLGAEHPELKAFPDAKEGAERFVIVLPHKERGEEDAFKVELIPGKTMPTDGVNLMRLGISIEARPLKGWGYTYYEVTGRDVAMSTMMAPPAGNATGQEVCFWCSAADPLQQPLAGRHLRAEGL